MYYIEPYEAFSLKDSRMWGVMNNTATFLLGGTNIVAFIGINFFKTNNYE